MKVYRIFALLCLLLLLSVNSGNNTSYVFAKTSPNYEYEVNDDSVTIVKYIGNQKHVNVPSKIDGYPVTYIDLFAFEGTDIQTVYIPNSVNELSSSIFLDCESLTGVIFGNGLIEIPLSTFSGCKNLKYIILGKKVTTVNKAFHLMTDYNKLEYISINNDECHITNLYYIKKDFSIISKNKINIYQDNIKAQNDDYATVTFYNKDKKLLTQTLVAKGTKLIELYGLADTSNQVFVGWYESESLDKKVDKVGNKDITVYAKFENKPTAPTIKVTKKSNTEYNLSWKKSKDYFYQVEVKDATYRGNNAYKVLQKYKKDIGSYTAKVSANYDKIFRVICYKIVDGVKVYSNYSKEAYSSKPNYPDIYVDDYTLDMNYVGGVDNYISFYNNASKSIKYITFTVVPYNRVDDKITCDIQRTSSYRLKVTGPIKKDEIYEAAWDPVWYNYSTEYAIITKAEIIYMDGTTKNISLKSKSN